jgi:hypothetical protein
LDVTGIFFLPLILSKKMQLGIPHACDVNVPLQRRLHEDMDTCAFTARERVGRAPTRESDAASAPEEQRSPARRTEEWRSPHLAPPTASEGLPTWAVVLALAVALAAVAYFNTKKKK